MNNMKGATYRKIMRILPFAIIVFNIFTALSWAINLIMLVNCDWTGPWKDEIIHGIGAITYFGSLITIWF